MTIDDCGLFLLKILVSRMVVRPELFFWRFVAVVMVVASRDSDKKLLSACLGW